jgi:short-subunit dehydrogenase
MNVVITGASAGIGRALASTFARHGHPVLAVARRQERLETLSRELVEEGAAPVYPLALDLTESDAPQAVFEHAVEVFERVHVLINNAGMSPYQTFQEMSARHIRQTLALNIQALTELCHFFIPHMLAHGEASHLVNVGSVGAYVPLPRFAVYSGSKHYVRVFTNLLRYECRGTNIQVSALHPGGVLTEFPQLAGQSLKETGRKNMMTPEKLAAMAYPAILKGRRVIVPGTLNKLFVLVGKFLPAPWVVRLAGAIYDRAIEPIDPTYD